MAITTQMRTQVAQLYVSLFGRAPERDGLGYWVQQLDSGKTFAQVAQDMYNVDAARAFYPKFLTNQEIVAKFYVNVLGRTADADGLAYWTAQLNSGKTQGQVISDMVNAVVAYAGTDADAKKSQNLFNNKVDVGLYYAVDMGGNSTTNTALYGVDDTAASVTGAKAAVSGAAGQTFALTKNVDSGAAFMGGGNNDTFNAVIDTSVAGNSTWTALDAIDGGNGSDTFNLSAITDLTTTTMPGGTSVNNIETINIVAAGKVGAFSANATGDLDLSTVSGVTALNVMSASEVDFKAPTSANVNVKNVTGGVEVVGGASQTVSLAAQGGNVSVSGSKGAVSVTSAAHGNNTIAVDGGSTVAITTASKATAGTITVGANTAPTGAITVTKTLSSDGSAAQAGGAVTITKAGTTANVTVNASSTATATTATSALTLGVVSVTGGGATTDVTVLQAGTTTKFTKAEVPVVKETAVVTFKAMKSGETLVINGLTFTAAKDLTADQAAAAFASLTKADTQSATGIVANGIYSGTFNTAVWTSGAASGAVVTFTAQDEDETDLVFSGTATTNDAAARTPTQVKTTGTAAVAKVDSTNSIVLGAVAVADAATATIANVSVNGYLSADLGVANNDLNALKTLSLANSAGTAAIATSATSLNLTVNKVKHAVDFSTASAALATLNVTTATADSAFALTAAQVKSLTVGGTNALDLTGSTLTALESVVVKDTAGLTLDVAASKSIDTTATTGKVTSKIDASAATYAGGAGVDALTLTAAAVSKSVDLGAGDDSLTLLANSTTVPTTVIKGGDGTDTLVMTTTSADSFDNSTAFATMLSGFERLTLSNAYGTDDATPDALTVNLANLGFTNYVTTNGTVYGTAGNAGTNDTLTLDKMASGGTVVLGAKGQIVVQVTDAATGTADVLNVQAAVTTADKDVGTLTVANVETINLAFSDTKLDNDDDGVNDAVSTVTAKLVATKAATVNVEGNANVTLDMTGNTATTLIDASKATGKVSVTSANTAAATTIKGGSGADTLVSASTSSAADKLFGGDGNDSLTANKGLSELTGGAGADTFNIVVASLNVNSAATIMDLGSGDVIKFTGATSFKQAKIALDPSGNPNLVSYADAAIQAVGQNGLAWFQYNGNTYIVQDVGTDSSTFDNNTDMVVKIAGLVDLSTGASYNSTSNTLEFA